MGMSAEAVPEPPKPKLNSTHFKVMNTESTTVQLDPSNRLPIRIETAPAFGGGTMDAKQEMTFVLLAHLFPIIIWPWKRSASPAVDAHGKEALNMGITLMLIMFPLGIISGLLGATVATIVSIGTSLLSFATLMLVVIACLKAQQGWILRYPLNFRLIK